MGFKINGGLCDVCNKSLRLKVHAACSRKRQAMHAADAPRRKPVAKRNEKQLRETVDFLAKTFE